MLDLGEVLLKPRVELRHENFAHRPERRGIELTVNLLAAARFTRGGLVDAEVILQEFSRDLVLSALQRLIVSLARRAVEVG